MTRISRPGPMHLSGCSSSTRCCRSRASPTARATRSCSASGPTACCRRRPAIATAGGAMRSPPIPPSPRCTRSTPSTRCRRVSEEYSSAWDTSASSFHPGEPPISRSPTARSTSSRTRSAPGRSTRPPDSPRVRPTRTGTWSSAAGDAVRRLPEALSRNGGEVISSDQY